VALQANLQAKASRGKEAMLPETAHPNLDNQQLRRRKQKRAQASVTSNAPSIASSRSSHRSPQRKRQRKIRLSPKPHIPLDESHVLGLGEEDFSEYLWDHQFNFDYMRDDDTSAGENNFDLN